MTAKLWPSPEVEFFLRENSRCRAGLGIFKQPIPNYWNPFTCNDVGLRQLRPSTRMGVQGQWVRG